MAPPVKAGAKGAAKGKGDKEPEAAQEQHPPPIQFDENGMPTPIPKDWKDGRGNNAEAWFQQQKDTLNEQYHGAKHDAVLSVQQQRAAQEAKRAYDARVQGQINDQTAASHALQQQLAVLRQGRLEADAQYKALRLPHHTPPRALAILTAEGGGSSFAERIVTRAVATTLAAAATPVPAPGSNGGSEGGAAGATSRSMGAPSREAVWCELLASRASCQDPALARLEAMERCGAALVLLSASLEASHAWHHERKLLAARLAAPPGTWPGEPLRAVVIVRLTGLPGDAQAVQQQGGLAEEPTPKRVGGGRSVSVDALASPALLARFGLPLPEPVPGYPVERYPVTVLELAVPQPAAPAPAAEGATATAAGTAAAALLRGAVEVLLNQISEPLATAGIALSPSPPPVHLHPSHLLTADPTAGLLPLLAGATLSGEAGATTLGSVTHGSVPAASTLGAALGGLGSSSLGTQLLAAPASAALAAGPATAAALLLPGPAECKAVEDWNPSEVAVWVGSLGRSIGRWGGGLAALAVDGPLLQVLGDRDLATWCGVSKQATRAALMEALAGVRQRTSDIPPARSLLPGPGQPGAALMPEVAVMPPHQLRALLAEVFDYYDRDSSGDLNLAELGRLLSAAGLHLGDTQLKDVLDDYDDDSDGRLVWLEAERLLTDLWRLVMGQQDVAAWTPSSAADLLNAATRLACPLDTPLATPDSQRGAPPQLGMGGGARRSDASGASGASSINITSGGPRYEYNANAQASPRPALAQGSSPRLAARGAPASPAGSDASASPSAAGGGPAPKLSAAGGKPAAGGEGVRRVSMFNADKPEVRLIGLPLGAEASSSSGWTAASSDSASVTSVSQLRQQLAKASHRSEGAFSETAADQRERSHLMARGRLFSRAASSASFAWGAPPRSAADAVVGSKIWNEAAAANAGAPWSGAITPRVARSGPSHTLTPEVAAARDLSAEKLLRPPLEPQELREALQELLQPLDLRRSGAVAAQQLGASLAALGPVLQLSPAHTHMLAQLAEQQAAAGSSSSSLRSTAGKGAAASSPGGATMSATQRSVAAAAAAALAGSEVQVRDYLSSGVEAVLGAQEGLMLTVYGERGSAALLDKLYQQAAGPEDQMQVLKEGPSIKDKAAEQALVALMEVKGLKASALVRAALLPGHQQRPGVGAGAVPGPGERDAGDYDDEADEAAGRAMTPQVLAAARRYPRAWSSATAHVVHVFAQLGGGARQ